MDEAVKRSERSVAPIRTVPATARDVDKGLVVRLRNAILKSGNDGEQYDDVLLAVEEFFDSPQGFGEHAFEAYISPIAAQLEHASITQASALEAILNQEAGAALAVTPLGRLIHANAAASQIFGCTNGDDLEALGINAAMFRAYAARLRGEHKAAPVLVVAYPGGRETPLFLVAIDRPAHNAILLTEARTTFPPGFAASLNEMFGLTAAESAILEGLAQGRSAEAIADETGRSVGTVRQHIKALLAKLNMPSQTQAVALVVAAISALAPRAAPVVAAGDCPLNKEVVSLSGGRAVELRSFGDPDGTPVLMIHGSIFGAGSLPAERQAARTLGLRVIAPLRPGHGGSLARKRDADLIALAADDAIAILDLLGIRRAMLLTDGIGMVPSMQAICAAPERFAVMVASSPAVPFVSWSGASYLPARMRAQLWAARNMPAMSEVMIRMAYALAKAKGFTVYPELVLGGPCFDLDVWLRPEYYPAIEDRCTMSWIQGPRASREDLAAINHNWSTLAAAVPIPVHLIHGRRNEATRLSDVENLLAIFEKATLEVVDDAGITVTLSHHDLILRRVMALAVRHGLMR
jgi:pimeloyl-ACP methyl ester carboxylesterase/DNA-binding CsgD family transcriptional regulator